jgi:hypothetical protein
MSTFSSHHEFFKQVLIKYPESKNILPFIEKTLKKSEITSISIEPLKYGSAVSLPNRIVISPNTLSKDIYTFLFTLFHELAHQFQFKKYGYDKMMELYGNNISVDDAADLMYNIEIVADEYAIRKIREMIKMNLLPSTVTLPLGTYKKTPKQTFIKIIEMVKEMLEGMDYKNSEELGEKLYDILKLKI